MFFRNSNTHRRNAPIIPTIENPSPDPDTTQGRRSPAHYVSAMPARLSRPAIVLLAGWGIMGVISAVKLLHRIPRYHPLRIFCDVSIIAFLAQRLAVPLLQSAPHRHRRDLKDRISFGVVLMMITVVNDKKIEAWEKFYDPDMVCYVLALAWLHQILEATSALGLFGRGQAEEEDHKYELLHAGSNGAVKGTPSDSILLRNALTDVGYFFDAAIDVLVEMAVAAPGWAILWRDVDPTNLVVWHLTTYIFVMSYGALRTVGASKPSGRFRGD